MFVYVGTYSKGGSKGIYIYEWDERSGELRDTGLSAQAQNPSFLAPHPSGRFLFAANETGEFESKPGGAVSAFARDSATGALSLLNQRPSLGAHPCHVAVHPSGRALAVANYSGGSVASYAITNDGQIREPSAFFQHEGSGSNPQRQREPHAHSVTFAPGGRFALACDLGTDSIVLYGVDASGNLVPGGASTPAPRAGAGPRHIDFHPSGRLAFVANELDSSVSSFAFDAQSGALHEINTLSSLPEGFTGENSGADIHAAPSGRFVYASNRGHDSIAIFACDSETGRLALIGHQPTQGRTPRNFSLDPGGSFLLAANQDSNSIVIFRVDKQSGHLAPTGQSINVPSPVCVRFAA